jgi:hypothetical protein
MPINLNDGEMCGWITELFIQESGFRANVMAEELKCGQMGQSTKDIGAEINAMAMVD